MNRFQAKRRQKLAELLNNRNVPYKERFMAVAEFLEREVNLAYRRGFGDGASRRPSALKAGKLKPVKKEGRA
jgi:hypothetical protein